MEKINLKSQEIELFKPSRVGSGATAFGSLVLILSLVGFFVSNLYSNRISSELEGVSAKINTSLAGLEGERFKDLYDFQDRVLELEKIEKNKANQIYILELLERYTLKEITFLNLTMKADEGNDPVEIEGEIVSNDYGMIERQAKIFEASEEIDSVIIKMAKTEKDKVTARLALKIKTRSEISNSENSEEEN